MSDAKVPEQGEVKAYQNPAHPGNGTAHHTGKRCIERDCPDPAGTWWSPLWCFKHNVERMDRISASLEKVAAALGESR